MLFFMCCSSEGSLCSSALICLHDIAESVVCQLSKLCQLSPLPRLSYGNIPVACDRLTCSLTSDPALMYTTGGSILTECHSGPPSCDSQPCMNGARCSDGWNRFICDCTFTSFTGKTCTEGTGPASPAKPALKVRTPLHRQNLH